MSRSIVCSVFMGTLYMCGEGGFIGVGRGTFLFSILWIEVHFTCCIRNLGGSALHVFFVVKGDNGPPESSTIS